MYAIHDFEQLVSKSLRDLLCVDKSMET